MKKFFLSSLALIYSATCSAQSTNLQNFGSVLLFFGIFVVAVSLIIATMYMFAGSSKRK